MYNRLQKFKINNYQIKIIQFTINFKAHCLILLNGNSSNISFKINMDYNLFVSTVVIFLHKFLMGNIKDGKRL